MPRADRALFSCLASLGKPRHDAGSAQFNDELGEADHVRCGDHHLAVRESAHDLAGSARREATAAQWL